MSAGDLYGARVVFVKMSSPPRAIVLRDDLSGRYYLVTPDGDKFALKEISPAEIAKFITQ
jgi:hypothetical protein